MHTIKNITIAITSYNRPILLQETLMSIENLGVVIKVLIVDDNSPRFREISKVVSAYESSHLKISFYRNEENLGEVNTKKKLFRLVDTEYFFLLGDDDTLDLEAQKLFVHYDELNAPFDFIFFGYRIINENNQVLKTRKSLRPIISSSCDQVILKIFSRYVTFPFYYFHPALYLVNTETAMRLSLDDSIGIGEDYDLLWRIMNDSTVQWIISPKVIVNWRKHSVQSANQSASLQNRLNTKARILIKYKNSNTELSRFWFLLLPTFFDLHSGLDISISDFSIAERKVLSLGRFKIFRFLGIILYTPYKIYEYSRIQLKPNNK
jgi:glycosyltransferase involved in cell wall biosynthesis